MKRNPTARQGRDSMDSINNSPHRIREKDNNRPRTEKGSKGARGPAIVIDRKDRQIASQTLRKRRWSRRSTNGLSFSAI